MKIALIVAIYKRHDLEKIVLDRFRKQSKKFGFDIIVAGSEGDSSKKIAKGCHYIEVENSPLSNKHNAMLVKAKELDVDGVVLMGSDDMVSDSYFDWIYSLSKDEKHIQGLKDIYFYSVASKTLHYWHGYRNKTQSAGAGRFFSRWVLDEMNWKLWKEGLEKGLDNNCTRRLLQKGIKDKSVSMSDKDLFLVDIKHSRSITSEAIIYNCKQVESEIMAKKTSKTDKAKVDKLETKKSTQKVKTVYNAGDVVKFKSNGKSKHLPKDRVYEIDGLKANLFLSRGFGQIVD